MLGTLLSISKSGIAYIFPYYNLSYIMSIHFIVLANDRVAKFECNKIATKLNNLVILALGRLNYIMYAIRDLGLNIFGMHGID